jgi:DnaJ-class molecular chaperone
MSTICTRCEGTGFLNLEQVDDATCEIYDDTGDVEVIRNWMATHEDSDVSVCDCCGGDEGWHGTPGEHYNPEDPPGPQGPYAYNGGLCECH